MSPADISVLMVYLESAEGKRSNEDDMQPLLKAVMQMKIDLSKSQLADLKPISPCFWNGIKNEFNCNQDPKEIMVQHFWTHISLKLDIVRDGFYIDVGSGAGFPGIPIKIMCPEISLTLVDSVQKDGFFK